MSKPTNRSNSGPITASGRKPPSDERCPNPKWVWYRSTLLLGTAGSLLLWAAFPPLAWGWLAWLAPIPWLELCRRQRLPGNWAYQKLYLAGFIFWLLTIHWLRLPHPATSIGWIALSGYLALYLPAFIALSRIAVHRLHVPVWLAAPVTWTGLELARAHLLTGFLMAALGHTQASVPQLIQISDLTGAYGVSFLVMLVAAGLARVCSLPWIQSQVRSWPQDPLRHSRWYPLLPALCAVAAVWIYGEFRLRQYATIQGANDHVRGPRVALIQGNSLAVWKHQPNMQQKIMEEYFGLSLDAVQRARQTGNGRQLDLVIWPETMFRARTGIGLVSFDDGAQLPREWMTPGQLRALAMEDLAALVNRLQTAVLVGIDRRRFLAEPIDGADSESGGESTHDQIEIPPVHAFNSAAMMDATGQLIGTYDKVHRVMFGEYVPLADWIPMVNRIKALTGGIEAGHGPVALELDGFRYAPNICYETVIPHVIRSHVHQLSKIGKRPDVLVNLTNDAWYWGSSELDMHLACGVFRAVECRTPLVVAANGGISADIDSCGRVVQHSPRQATDVIISDVRLDPRNSLYRSVGDWFAGICLVCCVALACVGSWVRTSASPGRS